MACYARGNSSPQLKLGISLPQSVDTHKTGVYTLYTNDIIFPFGRKIV